MNSKVFDSRLIKACQTPRPSIPLRTFLITLPSPLAVPSLLLTFFFILASGLNSLWFVTFHFVHISLTCARR